MKEKKHTPVLDIIIFALGVAVLCICTGCSTKSRHLDISGAYLNQAGTVAIGSIEAQSAPEGVESAMVSYEDSAAWFSDAKEHRIRILLPRNHHLDPLRPAHRRRINPRSHAPLHRQSIRHRAAHRRRPA